MSERKVLNKYYPPDFDPTKIPKIKRPKNFKKGTFSIRIMAPFNMRCNTCGEYIYKGKKFNSRKETVENETYLGLHIFRFYIKCPRCIAEIAFKTDLESTDYTLEAGATRNFEATRTAERLALEEIKAKEAEEANNPMKVLENRTKASLQEINMLEQLEDLRELRTQQAGVDTNTMLLQSKEQSVLEALRLQQLQEEEDEAIVRQMFGSSSDGQSVKRILSDSEDESDDDASVSRNKRQIKIPKVAAATDLLVQHSSSNIIKQPVASEPSRPSQKDLISGIIRRKPPSATASATVSSAASSSAAAASESSSGAEAASTSGHSETRPAPANSGKAVQSSGLLGLGAYSSTDTSSGDDDD